jgi:hypothetical protein
MDSISSISFPNEPENMSWPFLSSLLGGFGFALLLHPRKSDDKNGQEMLKILFNWSEVHSEKKYYLHTYRIHTLDLYSIYKKIFYVDR